MSTRPRLLATLTLAVFVSTGCFVRRRTVIAPAVSQNRPLLTATKEELIQRIHSIFDPIQSFNMRVDLSPSIIGPTKQSITDYATIGAYILFRRPDELRILGQDPVLGTTIFDMVSSGKEFHLSLPRRKQFFIGSNDSPGTSSNQLENLRPVAFLTALMIYPPDPPAEVALLEDDTSESKAVYILLIVRRDQDQLWLARNVYFDRYTLDIVRQKTFDPSGSIVSETNYSDWKNFGGASFPSELDIRRPKENYEVQLSVVNMSANAADVTPEKFVLNQPADAELKQLK
jgi:hypothetical protein